MKRRGFLGVLAALAVTPWRQPRRPRRYSAAHIRVFVGGVEFKGVKSINYSAGTFEVADG